MKSVLFVLLAATLAPSCAHAGAMTPDRALVAMAAFRTYNGQPLQKLLGAHGVTITSATPTLVSSLPRTARKRGDQPGDIVWDVELHASRPRLPCGLNEDFSTVDADRAPVQGRGDTLFEVTQRGAVMPANPSDLRDAMTYWLAKGECRG